MERKAIFCGSFDPFTIGHAHIVERGLEMFDHIVIGIGHNMGKSGWLPIGERLRALEEHYSRNSRVTVEAYSCLTGQFAREHGAKFILRGLRSVNDYEYELQAADVNRSLFALETVILFSDPRAMSVSSSLVRELSAFGHDITPFLPQGLTYHINDK